MKANSSKEIFLHTKKELPVTKDTDRINSILNIFKGVEEYILDSTGTVVSSNLEAVTITGYEEWEVIGRHFSIFYSMEDQIKRVYDDDLNKASLQGHFSTTGIKMKKRNSPFWAKFKMEAISDTSKNVSGFRLTIQDATHKALYNHSLNLIKDEYLNLFNNPFIGIFKFRMSDFKILTVNEKSQLLFGRNWNKTFLDTVFIDSSKFTQLIQDLQENKRIENYEFEMVTPNGTKCWVSLSCKYFSSVGFVEGVIMDITERKREVERTLNLSNELESFIYHASHDLRSPITSIHGLVNLLRKEVADAKVLEYSKLIEGRVNHLDNILRDIVEIAFNTAVPISIEPIDIPAEISSIAKAVSRTFPSIHYTLDFEASPIPYHCDLTRLRSIIRNVVANAFKYSNPSQHQHVVSVKTKVSAAELELVVIDNGIGIKPEFREKIFSLFYKATESYKGNGLGLYIVNSMVEKLNGALSFETEVGEGTRFTIRIPNFARL